MTEKAWNARPVPLDEAHSVVEHWITFPNIVMLDTAVKQVGGHRTGQLAIVVGVIEKKRPDALTDRDLSVPPAVEVDVVQPDGSVRRVSMPTDVIETGVIRPMGSLSLEERPCPGGFKITAVFNPEGKRGMSMAELPYGTLGLTTYYQNKRCFLTNAHVIGTAASGPGTGYLPGCHVYQPAPDFDAHVGAKVIGVCDGTFVVTSHFGNKVPEKPFVNEFDFAWCEVPPVLSGARSLTSHAIHDLYKGEGWLLIRREPEMDETVKWVGAKTGEVQRSTVESVHAVLDVQDRPPQQGWSYWRNLIRVRYESTTPGVPTVLQHGDSGSALIAESDNQLIGLMTFGPENGRELFATRIPPDNPQVSPDKQRMVLRPRGQRS
ncbi:hypothetical protein ACIPWI_35170 [Streptomyces sp. NPDC090046]|uniref:hypothetical protein n=1 Tax=Streptomyces sp. NPDC090046 TaxID=3365928 RepID=UPI0037FC90F6